MLKKIEIIYVAIVYKNMEVKSRQRFKNGRFKKKMDIADCNNNVVILNEEEKSNEFQVNSIGL